MKKYRFEIIIFIVDAIVMILELIASRLLSPYFGNSNIVWTSVIWIILLSSSLWSYLGGKIADNKYRERSLKIVLIWTALFMFLIPFIQRFILTSIASTISSIKIWAILSTILIFFIPSFCMGTVNPIILKLKLGNLSSAWKTAGKISAIWTIWAIVWTFLWWFVLVPNFWSNNIIFVLTIILLITAFLVNCNIKEKSNIFIVIMAVISYLAFVWFSTWNLDKEDYILSGIKNTIISHDTEYWSVRIYNSTRHWDNIRILNIDWWFESATFTDEWKQYDLVFEYTKYYDKMFEANIDINNVLLIWWGWYSYPKYYISHYDNKKMDVVEIDPKITEIARKYFYLDKLIRDFNLEENGRLKLMNEDGRTYLNNNNIEYDAILNDAFSGDNPAKTLTTIENIRNIKKSLKQNGVYLTNIISSLEWSKSKFLRAEVNTLKKVFNNVYVIPCNNIGDLYNSQNNMVIATDDDLDLEWIYDLKLDENEIVITDDYCPIDSLTASLVG